MPLPPGAARLEDIMGNRMAKPQELRFLASIQHRGTLVQQSFVQTAASCFQSL